MLLASDQAIAIEAKYTEGEYESVKDWLGSSPSYNRRQVLNGWLSLINRATGVSLQEGDVKDITYQLIHRASSACYPQVNVRSLVYQYFDPSTERAKYYRNQLSYLKALINRPEQLTFYLVIVGLQKSKQYQELQASWDGGSRNLSSAVKQGLMSDTLMSFDTPIIERI